jgi:hypothetical protein
VTHGEKLLELIQSDPGRTLVHYKKLEFGSMDSANFRLLIKKLIKNGKIEKKRELLEDTDISVIRLYPL